MVLTFGLAPTAAAQAPTPAQPSTGGTKLPVRFSGEAESVGEGYAAHGIEARRPGSSYRLSLTPQMTLFGQFSAGFNILLSSEGSDLRQNISQLGFNPRYKWITMHVGDFSQTYSSYTVEGTRIRGGGVDLRPGILRFSLQAGRSQRTVSASAAGLAYKRNLYAASAGIGREGSSFIDFIVAKSKDDVSSLSTAVTDTTLLDTIAVALRPRIETRPQENLVVGTKGQVSLFSRRVTVRGEAAGSLITRDLESPDANPAGVSSGATLNSVLPLRLSTSGDYAYKVETEANLGRAGLRGGYEYVGAGYTSLGLAYLINDRRAFNLGGNLRLIGSRLNLQGQYQHQNDNMLGQKSTTTNRNALVGSAAILLSQKVSTSLTAVVNTMANHATVDTFLVDNHAFALTSSTSVQTSLFGRNTTISTSYALQRTADNNVITRIPGVTVHNLSTSVQVAVSKAVSLAPTASFAVTENAAAPTQQNVYVGFRGTARLKKVRTSFSATQTFSSGRGVFGVNGQLSYTLPWQGRLTFQARHNRYAAIGNRPAFDESFATLSLARSF
jgi:hypothetical protein